MKTRKQVQVTKKLASLVLVAALSGVAGAQMIRATVDGNFVTFPDVQPMMMNNRVMVPIRGVFEQMSADVAWDSMTRRVTAQRGTDTIVLPINSILATVNGREIRLDTPAIMRGGRVMVPLRFLSESLSATVDWNEQGRTVSIVSSNSYTTQAPLTGYTMRRLDIGTVVPFNLVQRLGSGFSKKGDLFDARLETAGLQEYEGLPMGSMLQGHINTAVPRVGNTPGILGLTFDRVKLPDGKSYRIFGSLIGLDENNTKLINGRIISKPGVKNDNLKFVGYGTGPGALVPLVSEGAATNDELIDSALDFLFAKTQKNPTQVREVILESGSSVGVRLDREFTFHILDSQNR